VQLRMNRRPIECLACGVEVFEGKPILAILGRMITEPLYVGLSRLQHDPIVCAGARHEQLHLGDIASGRDVLIELVRDEQHPLLPGDRLQGWSRYRFGGGDLSGHSGSQTQAQTEGEQDTGEPSPKWQAQTDSRWLAYQVTCPLRCATWLAILAECIDFHHLVSEPFTRWMRRIEQLFG
jgi:hypothetical protein